jgi:hypothetical protein
MQEYSGKSKTGTGNVAQYCPVTTSWWGIYVLVSDQSAWTLKYAQPGAHMGGRGANPGSEPRCDLLQSLAHNVNLFGSVHRHIGQLVARTRSPLAVCKI